MLLGATSTLSADDIVVGRATKSPVNGKRLFTLPQDGLDLATLDRDFVEQAIERADGNQTKAAELLGITRDQLHYRLQKYASLKPRTQGVRPPGERPPACGEGAGAACVAQYGRARRVRPATVDRPADST